MLYDIRVQLQYIKPLVWRRLHVPSRTSLLKFHEILQQAMGWTDSHLYLFEVGKERYGENNEEWGMDVFDAKKITLDKIFSAGIKSFIYEYDMGDGWRHQISILGEIESEEKEKPACVAGARACPPEDCGGPPGYEYFLEAIRDSAHEEHDDMLEWIGGEFDPEEFNLEEADQAIKRVR